MITTPTLDIGKKEREAKKTIEKLQIYLKKNESSDNKRRGNR